MKTANALEFKDTGEADDPTAEVAKQLAELKTALETKAANDNTKLTERLDRIEAKVNRPNNKPANDNEPDLETKAFTAYLRNPTALETKTLRVSDDTRGGYLAPPEFTNEFIRDLVPFSPIRSVASVKQTSFGSVSLMKRTGITNAKWKGELADSEESEPAFGGLDIPVREINTYVDISNQLLQDASADVNAEVRLALAEDFGQKEGLAFVSGSGPLQPEGLLSNPNIPTWQMPTGETTEVSVSALIDLLYGLPAFYRNRGVWLLNGTLLAQLRKLQNSIGQPVWQAALAAGQPETLLGRPLLEIPDFPDAAANTTPIMFGDFAIGYRIVDRLDLATLVDPYTRRTQGATRIHATRRVGAGVIQPNALVKLKMAAA